MAVFVEREHLHRDVARLGILFEMIQDRPAQHVRQEDIERDGGGAVLLGQRQRFGAGHGAENLEPLVSRQIAKHMRVVQIVFNDEQYGVTFHQVVAVVFDAGFLFGRGCLRQEHRHGRCQSAGLLSLDDARSRGAHICLRQVEGEGASLAGYALQLDFAAQQAGEFAADGETHRTCGSCPHRPVGRPRR